MRKGALEQSRFFVDQQLGDPHITVADVQERLERGDTFTVALFMRDDVQLPPVCDTPVYISDCHSVPSNHGHEVWTMFELTQIIRQDESEQQL